MLSGSATEVVVESLRMASAVTRWWERGEKREMSTTNLIVKK